jgi:hypothetical protein
LVVLAGEGDSLLNVFRDAEGVRDFVGFGAIGEFLGFGIISIVNAVIVCGLMLCDITLGV